MFKKKEAEKLKALFQLIDEPDGGTYESICQSIASYGIEVNPLLQNLLENTFDPEIRERIARLIHRIHMDSLYSDLYHWTTLESKNFLKGYLLLTKYIYPDLDVEKILNQLDGLERDIWLELNANLTALEEIKVINKILFEAHDFTPTTRIPPFPEKLALNNLLDSQKGHPTALSAFYAGLAQRLGLPLYMANIPDILVLAYVENSDEKKLIKDRPVLFYINPASRGSIFTRNEVGYYLRENCIEDKAEYYQPCDNIDLLKWVGQEIVESYDGVTDVGKGEELLKLLNVLC